MGQPPRTVIETGAILFVLFASGLIYVISRAATPRLGPDEQRARLADNIARLEKSLALAEQKSWDPAMRDGISGQLAAARRELRVLNAARPKALDRAA